MANLELKGIINLGKKRSITCCQDVQDITIGDKSLYDELEKLFDQDAGEYWEAPYDEPKQSPKYSVRYVILDKIPEDNKSFNDLSAKVVMEMLYAEHISGCYSEWTCGYGDFDYVTGEDGHSIFEELKDKEGKYIHFVI